MNTKKLLFILTITLILLSLIITNANQHITKGTIQKITYSEKKITITVENQDINYILFTKKILSLKKGDEIKIQGTKNTYKQQEQIIVNKITKLN